MRERVASKACSPSQHTTESLARRVAVSLPEESMSTSETESQARTDSNCMLMTRKRTSLRMLTTRRNRLEILAGLPCPYTMAPVKLKKKESFASSLSSIRRNKDPYCFNSNKNWFANNKISIPTTPTAAHIKISVQSESTARRTYTRSNSWAPQKSSSGVTVGAAEGVFKPLVPWLESEFPSKGLVCKEKVAIWKNSRVRERTTITFAAEVLKVFGGMGTAVFFFILWEEHEPTPSFLFPASSSSSSSTSSKALKAFLLGEEERHQLVNIEAAPVLSGLTCSS